MSGQRIRNRREVFDHDGDLLFHVQVPEKCMIMLARQRKNDGRQLDVYGSTVFRRRDDALPGPRLQYCVKYRWCRRDKRYYGNHQVVETMLEEPHKWKYWFDGDILTLLLAQGIPLEHYRLVETVKQLSVTVMKRMPAELRQLIQHRAPVRMDNPVYCDKCHDWFPTIQLRYVCQHILNCTRTDLDGCGAKASVREECRKYSTCFEGMSDQDRRDLIRSISMESQRKHGWRYRMAYKPLMHKSPIHAAGMETRRFSGRAPNDALSTL